MSIDNLLKWASAIVALVPGLSVILANLGLPPGMSSALYGGIIEAAGAVSFLLLYLNRERIKQLPVRRINQLTAIFAVLFILSIVGYVAMFNVQVPYSEKYDTRILLPFKPGDELRYMIKTSGTMTKAIDDYGPSAIRDALAKSTAALELTRIMFTVLYLLVFEWLIFAFGFPGFKTQIASPTAS